MGDFEKSILRAYLYLKNSSKRSTPKKTVAQVQRAEKRHACDTGGGGVRGGYYGYMRPEESLALCTKGFLKTILCRNQITLTTSLSSPPPP